MTSFYQQKFVNRVHKLHCAPVTDKWWENMTEELWAQFANDNLTVCSDFFFHLDHNNAPFFLLFVAMASVTLLCQKPLLLRNGDDECLCY